MGSELSCALWRKRTWVAPSHTEESALRIHLGGAEALSSMGVVFVLILGIGVGNGIAGDITLVRPLLVLAAAEGSLALANSRVAMALTQGGTGRFFAEYQRFCLNNGCF